jgi:hypothetical protein
MLKLIFGDFLQELVAKGYISGIPVADLHSGPASPIFTADDVYVDRTSSFKEGGAEPEFWFPANL